jgi:hypothetical protein
MSWSTVADPNLLLITAAVTLVAGLLQAQRAQQLCRAALERWWMITLAVAAVMLFFAVAAGPQFGFIGYPMSVVVTPILTIVLGIRSPVPWGCASSAVTLLHGTSWLGSRIAGVGYAQADLATLASAYLLNVLFVAGLALVRAGRPRED